jgi:hypothetical protein
MQAAYCALVVALKYFPDDAELITARQHLETAIALSDQYYKVKHSIFWLTSKASIKRRVTQQLNELAFDTYSHMIDLADALNQYAIDKSSLDAPPPKNWQALISNLDCAFEWINREHPQEIKAKQLILIS